MNRLARVFLLYFTIGAAIAAAVMLWPLVLIAALLIVGASIVAGAARLIYRRPPRGTPVGRRRPPNFSGH